MNISREDIEALRADHGAVTLSWKHYDDGWNAALDAVLALLVCPDPRCVDGWRCDDASCDCGGRESLGVINGMNAAHSATGCPNCMPMGVCPDCGGSGESPRSLPCSLCVNPSEHQCPNPIHQGDREARCLADHKEGDKCHEPCF